MAVTVYIFVEDIDTVIATYSKIELERATSVGGSYSEVTELTLVADDFTYSYLDSSGTVNSWYRFRYSNAGETTRSDYSNPFRPDGLTRLKVRQHYMDIYRAGRVFTTDADGSTTSVSTDDAEIKTSLFAAGRGKGTWLRPNGGSDIGVVRRITDSSPSAGTFTVNPAYSAEVDSVEVEWHWLADPKVVDDCFNRACRRYWYLERVPITGVADQEEYDLATIPWLKSPKQVTGLWYYPYESSNTVEGVDIPFASNGRWFRIREDRGGLTLTINTSVPATQTLWLEALRQVQEVYTDASVLPAIVNIDLMAALLYDEVLAWLTRPGFGNSEDRRAWAQERQQHADTTLRRLFKEWMPKPKMALSPFNNPTASPTPYRAR